MKKEFTKDYIINNRGCYSVKQVQELSFINKEQITINDLIEHLSVSELCWFVINKCNPTLKELQMFALFCAEQVQHIYDDKYPKDKRIEECNIATRQYIEGEINKQEFLAKKFDAHVAADNASTYSAFAAEAAVAAAYVASTYSAFAAANAFAYTFAAADTDLDKKIKEYILNELL